MDCLHFMPLSPRSSRLQAGKLRKTSNKERVPSTWIHVSYGWVLEEPGFVQYVCIDLLQKLKRGKFQS
jgi:hypothetical protein